MPITSPAGGIKGLQKPIELVIFILIGRHYKAVDTSLYKPNLIIKLNSAYDMSLLADIFVHFVGTYLIITT